MEKKHIYFLEVMVIALFVLIAFLYSADKNNSASINSIAQEVNRLSEILPEEDLAQISSPLNNISDSLTDAEKNVDELNSQLIAIKENELERISGYVDTLQTGVNDVLKNLRTDSTESIENLNSSITQLSSALEEIRSAYGTELSTQLKAIIDEFGQEINKITKGMASNQSIQEQSIQDLKKIVLGLSEQLDLFSLYIQQATDGSAIASSSFELASDVTKNYIERRYYYLNAIMHNPTEPTYYTSYISFLDENNAVPDEYWMLATIIDSAMVQMDPSSIDDLLPIYEEISSETYLIESDTEEVLTDTYFTWQNSATAFLEKVKSGELDGIQADYDSVETAYNLLDEISMEDQEQYELINQLYSIYSTYFSLLDLYDRISKMDDDTFISSYLLFSQLIDSVKSAFLINAFGEEYENSFNATYRDVLDISEEINTRYDSIRALQLLDSIKSLSAEADRLASSGSLSDSNLDAIIEKYGEIQFEFSSYVSTITTQDSIQYINQMQEVLSKIQEKIYTAQFTEYQLWASSILSSASMVEKNYEKEDQLNALYELGYFEITPSLLIPQLSVVYNSIDWKGMEKRSSLTVDQLVEKYNPVYKGIGEV